MKVISANQIESGETKISSNIGYLKKGQEYYIFELGDEQMLDPNGVDKLRDAKKVKCIAIDNDFENTVKNGIVVDDITLDASPEARASFSQLLLLLREAGVADSYQITISSKYGEPFVKTFAEFRQIMLQYGMSYQTMWNTKLQRVNSVFSALTVEEVNQI